jgi:hypothetical protein
MNAWPPKGKAMKIIRFLSRFLAHLVIIVSVCLLVSKMYYFKTSLIELLRMQKEIIWVSVFAALLTAFTGQRFK